MNGSVKGLGLMVIALGLAACAGGAAGAGAKSEKVAPKPSLLGIWEGVPGIDPQSPKDTTGKAPGTHALLIGADSTYAEVTVKGSQAGCGGGKWAMPNADSVTWLQSNGPAITDKIVFKDNQFFLYRKGNMTKAAEAYRRPDTTVTPKPKHIAGLPQCATAGKQRRPATPAPSMTPAPAPATPQP